MLHERLKTARLASGLSQDQVIVKLRESGLEITKAALSYYENGKRTPDASMVRTLAQIYGTNSQSIFCEQVDFQINWYSYRASDHRLGKRKRQVIEAYTEQYAARLMQVYDKVPSFKPDFPDRKAVKTVSEADKVAGQLRRQWEIGLGPIESVIQCLENHGALVVLYDNEQTAAFDGLSAVVNDTFPLLIVNGNVPVDRLRFDLAHELGHILMNTSILHNDREEEKLVHRFASSFLVPPEIVKRELGEKRRNVTISELMLLKEKHGLSVAAWVYAAWAHGVINKSLYEQLCKTLSIKGWRKEEPAVYKGNETPVRLKQTVLRLISEGVITAQNVLCMFPVFENILENEGLTGMSKAERVRNLPPPEKRRLMEKAAGEFSEEYKNDKSLIGFDENDFYDYR